MAKLVVNIECQKDMCHNKIGLCTRNKNTIIGSIINIIGRSNAIIQGENLGFYLLWLLHLTSSYETWNHKPYNPHMLTWHGPTTEFVCGVGSCYNRVACLIWQFFWGWGSRCLCKFIHYRQRGCNKIKKIPYKAENPFLLVGPTKVIWGLWCHFYSCILLNI